MPTKIFLILIFPCLAWAAPAAREWEPLRTSDYWTDAGLAAGAFGAYVLIPQQKSRLGRENFFDDAGRDAFRFSSRGRRRDAEIWSNITMTAAIALPVAMDPALAWGRGGNARSAARITNINAQAFGLTAILTGTTKALIGRERPYVADCRRNPSSDPGCRSLDGDESFKSFYSGHSVYAFTGAGLACLHHLELGLYGDSRDRWACGSAIGLATAVAILRVGADKHYVTDVSGGAVIGLFSGYIFPRWLHKTRDVTAATGLWLPVIHADGGFGIARLAYF